LNRGSLSAILAIIVVVSALTGYAAGSINRTTTTVTSILSTTTTETTTATSSNVPCPTALNQTATPVEPAFQVEISYPGPWNATVRTYSAFEQSPAYLVWTCYYRGTETRFVYVAPWNINGEQTVSVVATKLDSSNGNLIVSAGWGAASRSNSTISPYGSASTFISVAP